MDGLDIRWVALLIASLSASACVGSGSLGTRDSAVVGDGGAADSDILGDGGALDSSTLGDGSMLDSGVVDAGVVDAGALDSGMLGDAGTPPPPGPDVVEPCEPGRPDSCWLALMSSGACGTSTFTEDFVTNRYNVHRFSLSVRADVAVDVSLRRTGGTWDPALVLHDASGATIYDGEHGVVSAGLTVTAIDSGRGSDVASVRILSTTDMQVTGFLTGWHVIEGGFTPRMPTDATYALSIATDCVAPGGVVCPPNLDESDIVGGYYLLPDSDPAGLYTRKARCSRGSRLLVCVLYTVAQRWAALRPGSARLAISDLNECNPRLAGDANHATHDDGTHVDIKAGCATNAGCDAAQSIDLAKLFIDTGETCGIIFNDTTVQDAVNPYFVSEYSYRTWHGGAARTFMRSVAGHTTHFHIRVKRPDGTCAPLN
ncbi:MAG: hypothetical protein GXP55_14160 [Deltaproteobacteria bacterium]|nr:hypothetical protein [Deltaproteobacteria bacterium]